MDKIKQAIESLKVVLRKQPATITNIEGRKIINKTHTILLASLRSLENIK